MRVIKVIKSQVIRLLIENICKVIKSFLWVVIVSNISSFVISDTKTNY